MTRQCKVHSCPALHSNNNGYCDQHQSLTHNRPCRTPGCPGLSVFRGYCEKCGEERSRSYDEIRRKDADAIYNADWQRLSRAYRYQHPQCERCSRDGIISDSVLVHHKVPISEGGDRLSIDNLEALCRDCHEIHHGRKPASKHHAKSLRSATDRGV